MNEIERIIKDIQERYWSFRGLDAFPYDKTRNKEHIKLIEESVRQRQEVVDIIEQYVIKHIKKRIKTLRNRRSYIRRKNSWQIFGEPSDLRAVADYLQEELKKGFGEQ